MEFPSTSFQARNLNAEPNPPIGARSTDDDVFMSEVEKLGLSLPKYRSRQSSTEPIVGQPDVGNLGVDKQAEKNEGEEAETALESETSSKTLEVVEQADTLQSLSEDLEHFQVGNDPALNHCGHGAQTRLTEFAKRFAGSGESTLQCFLCHKIYEYRAQLNQHHRKAHRIEVCQSCGHISILKPKEPSHGGRTGAQKRKSGKPVKK